MIFGGLEFVAVKYVGGKLLAAHAAHAAAGKAAFAMHHPISAAVQETTSHGLNSIMNDPAIHPALKGALLQGLLHQATGATAAAAAPHNAAQAAEMISAPFVMEVVRKTDVYQNLKELLSDRREDWQRAILSAYRSS
jgi:hypothetical protein